MDLAVRHPSARLGLLLGALLMPGCSEDATSPRPIPTAMSVAAGDGQAGIVGQPLDSVLSVFVTDKFGRPVTGVLVRFAVSGRSGSLTPITQTTGPSGHASARWTLPTTAGTHSATVSVSGLDSIVFHAVAAPAVPASISLVFGDLQDGATTTALDSAVVVRIRDGFGNSVNGAAVTFVTAPGSGVAVPAATRSDTAGQARTTWVLGEEPGLQALVVRVDSLPQLRVRAHALGPGHQVVFGPSLPPGSVTWRAESVTGAEDAPAEQAPRPEPSPVLRCWRNALGATVIPPDAGIPRGFPACDEPALGF